jgi:large subunit ribosomal protein L35Ae
MQGRILNFRQGRHTQNPRQVLIEIKGVDSREKALQLIGKKVVWISPSGKKIEGKISNAHGNKGVVRAIFEKGLPGQALTTEVDILD